MKSTIAKTVSLFIIACCALGSVLSAQMPKDLTKEFEAIEQARVLLTEVKDEESAKEAAVQIKKIFDDIAAVYKHHSDAKLTELHDKQNIINRIMVKLSMEDYFKDSGLQESWALIVDPESRKSTLRNKGRRRR